MDIRLLGELVVARGGTPLALPASKKTRALLAYLAATARPQPRDKLCALLWDGPDDPRAALRWSLTKLRPLLDEPGATRLVADRERVELVAAGATIDLIALRAAVPAGVARASTEALAAVAPLCGGEPFDGLDLPDCFRYDEWLRGEREAARRLALAVLAALVERIGEREPARALDHARAWLGLERLDEAAHAATIRLLAQLGRRDDALAAYARCERLFERELGRGPSRELERLRMALGSASLASAPAPPAAPAQPARPLVGRTAETAALADALAGPPGCVTVVLGEPGIGKTRLLDELAAIARERGHAVLRGRGVESELVRPFGAWIDALGAGADDVFRAQAELDRARLFGTIAAALTARGALLVILDDVQWLDEASAALVHYVARAAPEVRIACGARPGELADNPAALRLVRALTRDGAVRQIGLSPLSAAETRALAAAYAPGVDGDRVFAESGGHPLFAVEIARALARGDTAWTSLDALLAERLELLDGLAAELVPWAAALGGAFAAEQLAAITGVPLVELARAVAELEHRAIVRAAGAEWDFAHDLIRAAAYRRVSEPRRRLLHLQIARTLAAQADPDGERAIEIAHHAQLGGDPLLCARACLAAAARCLRLFAPDQATTLAERGLEHAARLAGEERLRLRIELLVVAYNADLRRARCAQIARELERAIVDARAAGCHGAAARGLQQLSVADYESGDWARARARSLDAMRRGRADADPAEQGRALAHTAQCIALLGRDIAEAEALASEAADLLGPIDDCAELPFALAIIRDHQGDAAAAIALASRAAELALASGRYWLAGYAWSRCALIELVRGRSREAIAHCDALLAHASRMGDGGDVPFVEVVAACARWQLGERDAPAMDRALAALRTADAPTLLASALCCVAELELAAGELAAAEAHARDAVAAAERAERISEAAIARSLLARIARAAGRVADLAPLAALDPTGLAARARAAIAAVV
ncbi:MAG TPA: AAA family ATPase [Kofleriaceae bacterium]|nr:AAA family ATPase [Kofleriaceae bacterium]